MQEFYENILRHKNSPLIFDVGANYGNRVKIFLRIGAKVIAIEPQPQCAASLRSTFNQSDNVVVIEKALGASINEAVSLHTGGPSTIASMSTSWIAAVKRSGRFSEFSWDEKVDVSMTTLDQLIGDYGVPDFIKIDVEGYELEVLKGLNTAVSAVSIEFTPEFRMAAIDGCSHLARLGSYCANFSVAESMQFLFEKFVPVNEFFAKLEKEIDRETFGDIYLRLDDARGIGSIAKSEALCSP